MDGTNGLKETTRVTAPVASNTLSVNVFTAPGKTMVGERSKPFGEAPGFDPITSTLIFGEYDAVLVDAMGTVAEAEALADWVALHNRNLETIYITHACAHSLALTASRSLPQWRAARRNRENPGPSAAYRAPPHRRGPCSWPA